MPSPRIRSNRPQPLAAIGASMRRLRSLRANPLFENVPVDEVRQTDELGTEVTVAEGRTLFTQGERGLAGALILEGTAEVCRDGAHVAEIGPGSVVGIRSVLTAECRNATVRTLTPVRLLALHAPDIHDLMAGTDVLARRIDEQVASHT